MKYKRFYNFVGHASSDFESIDNVFGLSFSSHLLYLDQIESFSLTWLVSRMIYDHARFSHTGNITLWFMPSSKFMYLFCRASINSGRSPNYGATMKDNRFYKSKWPSRGNIYTGT